MGAVLRLELHRQPGAGALQAQDLLLQLHGDPTAQRQAPMVGHLAGIDRGEPAAVVPGWAAGIVVRMRPAPTVMTVAPVVRFTSR